MIEASQTLNEVTLYNPEIQHLLDRFDLSNHDLNEPLSKLCEQKGEGDFCLEVLNMFVDEGYRPVEQLRKYPVPVLLNYLKETHKYYLNQRLPEIEQSIQNIISKHPENTWLISVLNTFFKQYNRDLRAHIGLEEAKLFPLIQELYDASLRGLPINTLPGEENYSLHHFVYEHDETVENLLNSTRQRIKDHQVSLKEALSFRILLTQMELLERDLRIHQFIEDDVLLPKAIAMEKEVDQTLA